MARSSIRPLKALALTDSTCPRGVRRTAADTALSSCRGRDWLKSAGTSISLTWARSPWLYSTWNVTRPSVDTRVLVSSPPLTATARRQIDPRFLPQAAGQRHFGFRRGLRGLGGNPLFRFHIFTNQIHFSSLLSSFHAYEGTRRIMPGAVRAQHGKEPRYPAAVFPCGQPEGQRDAFS